jgi:glycosyltransferase involved in cell wall biosynthesis
MTNTPVEASQVPDIYPVPPGTRRPLWSVMIPTFNSGKFLEDTLRSVLSQDLGPSEMQLEVIDDCSTLDDPKAVVEEVGKGRISYYRNTSNEGAIRTFNTCIQRSKGELIHILHGDDTVISGYYAKISEAARVHSSLGLYAARCFIVDEDSVITAVTDNLETLKVEAFYYLNPIQFAGITVQRSAYEELGGFRLDLKHTADAEMWARIVASRGGIVLPDVLANYRLFAANDTSRLIRTGENILDHVRLHDLYSKRYPTFSVERGRANLFWMAWSQYSNFKALGDDVAAMANYRAWCQVAPLNRRIIWRLSRLARAVVARVFRAFGLR